jgi:hypothetical protein
MPFDFKSFFESEGIRFIEAGKNVAKGHINVACPFCGDDPSFHMGVQLDTAFWGCYRNPLHRGKNPARLIRALKGCSYEQANEIAANPMLGESVPLQELGRRISALGKPPLRDARAHDYEMPDEFRPVEDTKYRRRFYNYLADDRGFGGDTPDVVRTYDLRCSLSGRWANRIILPFRADRRCVGWTGRSVERRAGLRYLTFPEGSGAKERIFNYDRCRKGGRALVVVEGPFDCVKVDFYGSARRVHACGLLSTSATPSQLLDIVTLARRYYRLVILLDKPALLQAMLLRDQLSVASPHVRPLVEADDPGEMTREQILALGI